MIRSPWRQDNILAERVPEGLEAPSGGCAFIGGASASARESYDQREYERADKHRSSLDLWAEPVVKAGKFGHVTHLLF